MNTENILKNRGIVKKIADEEMSRKIVHQTLDRGVHPGDSEKSRTFSKLVDKTSQSGHRKHKRDG